MGPRAEQGYLTARLAESHAQGDVDAERQTASSLARLLARRGAELDSATKLARRALLLGDDTELRDELSAWFAGLGEAALAAATLRPLAAEQSGAAARRTLTRVGVLLARAGDAAAAADVFSQACEHDRDDPVAAELIGALGAWAPEAVTGERAARAYLLAAGRREARGERGSAFEDLLRAFEMAPSLPDAAEQLARALATRGRVGAADEVIREHARASGDGSRAIHLARLGDLAVSGDVPRAIGAAFDAGLDAVVDPGDGWRALAARQGHIGAGTTPFGVLLDRAGLHELLSARVELEAEALSGAEAARHRVGLGRLYAGPLASPDRAVEAWMQALVEDPANEDAKALLRDHAAGMRDPGPLVEALIRVGQAESSEHAGARAACLEELAVLAEQRLSDSALALWAVGRMPAQGQRGDDDERRETVARLAPRVQLSDEALAQASADLDAAADEAERGDALQRMAAILRGRPDASDAYVAVLVELVGLFPAERAWRSALERVLLRLGRFGQLEALARSALAQSIAPVEEERSRILLAALRRRAGDLEGALSELRPLLGSSGAHAYAWSMALLLAARLGDLGTRAEALLRIASPLPPTLRAVLCSVASESLLAAGKIDAARAAAEQAGHADPSLARPAAALAAVAVARRLESDTRSIERAMGVVVPRARLCSALAAAHEDLDEPLLAIAWTQRWLALRPGDPEALRTLLLRVTHHGDAARLSDSVAWLLSQPQPLDELVEPLCEALRRLAALEPPRATALARRALDVVGPRVGKLREAVLDVADRLGEPGLAIAVVERWLAAGSPGLDRADALLDLARRRSGAGDADGAARALSRAMNEGADPGLVLAALERTPPARSSDGELWLLEVRAEALSGMSGADVEGASRAWREYGAALWDLAGDPAGAVHAWQRAAALMPERGVSRFARDVLAFGGYEAALSRLEELAASRSEAVEAARVLAEAATIALHSGDSARALSIAARALALDPSRADVLAVAERSAGPGDVEELQNIYRGLADAALGCYGERAVHYRAARQLERRGEASRALGHAIAAFEAVPAEGVAFVLAARLSERTGDSIDLVHALERVASRSDSAEHRAAWLRRAALFAGTTEEGKRQRVEVLLRAFAVRPEVETMRSLGAALRDLVAAAPEYKDIGELRFKRALDSMLPRLDGPEGARVAVEAASGALESFDSAGLALEALERAAHCDADVEEFAQLLPRAPRMAQERELAEGFATRVADLCRQPFSNVGRALAELCYNIAAALGDELLAARLLVHAALRDPEDRELVRRAELAAHASGDPGLGTQLLDAVPAGERVQALMDVAEAQEGHGELASAIAALERARAEESIDAAQRQQVFERLRDLYGRAGRRDALEHLLALELEREDISTQERVRTARDLAALISARGDPDRALGVVLRLLGAEPDHEGLLADAATLARQAGDRRRQAEALGRLSDLAADPDARLALLRELAELLEEDGQEQNAFQRWSQVLELDRDDVGALIALERDAERRGDYDKLVDLLARRAALATMVDDVRRIRLRRAMVLEQRLARPDDARAELEHLLAATGDNLSVLRVLADLDERLGASLRAAQLWMRASAVARERSEAADLARHACEAYLAGGDVASARRVLEGMEAWATSRKVLELEVEVERRSENPLGLADALEELALVPDTPPEQCASLLMEAAEASESGGDLGRALERAERAARLAPELAGPQLCARRLEYRVHGAGKPEQARRTVAELRGVQSALDAEQTALRAFLIAEALDVAVGAGAGLKELERAHANVGPLPLVALGMAERLAAGDQPARALALFDAALSGDLHGLRPHGVAALGAAGAARRSGELERALGYVELAAGEASTRADALALQAEIHAELRPVDSSPPRHTSAPPPGGSPSASVPPPGSSPRASERPPRGSAPPPRASAPPPRSPRGSAPPPRLPGGSVPPTARSMSSRPPAPAVEIGPAEPRRISSGNFPAVNQTEASLFAALGNGSLEAGKELVRQLENRSDRTHDLVHVCRRVVELVPGDRWVLEKLHEAALADHNLAYGHAVDHVLSLFDRSRSPVEAPPLEAQPEQPDHVRALLFRDTLGPTAEALALVWEGAEHVFRRDAGTYGVTGVERVPLGAPTPLAHIYSAAARALGLTRTPLFQRRSSGAVTVSVALLSPPALILSGDVRRESPELAFHVGAMLAAAMPEHVLLFGSPESQTRAVLKGLSLAFGSPRDGQSGLTSAANLAEVLWESIPARSQRRLRELCDEPGALDYDTAMATARRAVRRAGLFVTGDLAVALAEACADESIAPKSLSEPNGLSALCSASPAVADLVRLAASSEYAEARWQAAPRRHGGGRTAI